MVRNLSEKLLLVPVGEGVDNEIIVFLKENIEEIFHALVNIGMRIPLYSLALDTKRLQYNSSVILMNFVKPARYSKVLMVTDVDLYSNGLNFVFGEADLSKGVAIISLTRLHQSYYGLPENDELFKLRALKEAVHELGHLYGLKHCPDPFCVMHFSNSLSDTDRKSYEFCLSCKQKLNV